MAAAIADWTKLLGFALAAFAVFGCRPAFAGITVVSVPVETQIVGSCTIGSVPSFDFGAILAPTTAAIANGSIQFTCVPGTTWTIRIGQGTNFVSSLNMRRSGGSELLAYQMCGDAACNTTLSDSLGPSGTGTGSVQTQAIAARLVAGQTVRVGTYSDTVLLVVSF